MGSIPSSLRPFLDQVFADALQVVCLAKFCHTVDEHGCPVCCVFAKFGRLVIPWESVVVVVETFSEGSQGHEQGLAWVDRPCDTNISENIGKDTDEGHEE